MKSRREGVRTLRHFHEFRDAQAVLSPPLPVAGRLLLIRLDDIGDYLLYRNQLQEYKRSSRWAGHVITLLGNASWKPIFTQFDAGTVDDTIWVNKGEYLASAAYRLETWKELRRRGFDMAVAPSRTRPLVLDDLCMLAAAPRQASACVNTYVHAAWNRASDELYAALFTPSDPTVSEFAFNGEFSHWICGSRAPGVRPHLEFPCDPPTPASPLVCFVGANTRSRRWPVGHWIDFIKRYLRCHSGVVFLAGSGAAEEKIAAAIQAQTDAESLVGRVSLLQLLRRVAEARAVVTNDTMAAHLSVSLNRPTVIIANGVNHQRFTDYDEAGIVGVRTLYPAVFLRQRARDPDLLYHYTDALTSDIASIGAAEVLNALGELLNGSVPRPDDRHPMS